MEPPATSGRSAARRAAGSEDDMETKQMNVAEVVSKALENLSEWGFFGKFPANDKKQREQAAAAWLKRACNVFPLYPAADRSEKDRHGWALFHRFDMLYALAKAYNDLYKTATGVSIGVDSIFYGLVYRAGFEAGGRKEATE